MLLIDTPWPALHMGLQPSTDATAKVDAVDGSQAVSARLRRSDDGKLWSSGPEACGSYSASLKTKGKKARF